MKQRHGNHADSGGRDRRGPGAHSGAEHTPHLRDVRGTASSREGYQPETGTAAGEQLKGVETPEGRRSRTRREHGGVSRGVSPVGDDGIRPTPSQAEGERDPEDG